MAIEDILYGKKRHLFGGIEPSNMNEFSVVSKNGAIEITCVLPNDTVIEGQTLCSVEGAIIRRKSNGYPKDEFDGDKVADIKQNLIFVDTSANPNEIYYYAAFPYSKQGVYNRNTLNRAYVNIPPDLTTFTSRSGYDSDTESVKITIDVVIPEKVAGVVIRKSSVEYPVDINDGEEFMTITESGSYVDDTVDENHMYYYSAFTYISPGVYNLTSNNRTKILARRYSYIFGYDLDVDNENSSDRVSYPNDVDNYGYSPRTLSSQGSWDITPGDKFMPRPCMLKYDGTVAYYLDPNDYKKKSDGQTASDVTNNGFDGNAMMEWPKIYTYREEVDGVYKFRCSDAPLGDDWDCWCNYNANGGIIDHFYTAIYAGSNISNRTRSLSAQTMGNVKVNVSSDTTWAMANGNGWNIAEACDHLLIQDLLVMMAKTTNCQVAYGNGMVEGNGTSKTGNMDSYGMFKSGSGGGYNQIKVFGMENYWGSSANRRLKGWYFRYEGGTTSHAQYIEAGGSRFTAKNPFGLNLLNSDKYGYISGMITIPLGRIPYICSGSSTTYEADYYAVYTSDSLYNRDGYVVVGGDLSGGTQAGPFKATILSVASSSTVYLGLSYKSLN